MTSLATTNTSQVLASSTPASSTVPPVTTQQESALNTLLPLPDSDTIACLKFIHSIEPDPQPRCAAGPYSAAEVRALKCLSSEPVEVVQRWLLLYRYQRLSSRPQTDVPSQDSGLGEKPAPEKASYADVVKSGINIKHCASAKRPHEPSAVTKHSQLAPAHPSYRYWSTASGEKQPFETFHGFRRHEKERENYYKFLPNGLYDRSGLEPKCALCLHTHPDKAHFEKHGLGEYIEGARPNIKVSRKGNFKKLLKKHGVVESRINRLVKEWHYTLKKKSYSCGLCIIHLMTHTERINHLKNQHYEKGEDKTMWDSNSLIKGLLLEPQVNQEFRKSFGINPSSKHSILTWDPSVTQALQERLELGEETPWNLAQSAWELATRSESPGDQNNILATSSQVNAEELQPNEAMIPLVKDYSNAVRNAIPAASSKVFATAAAGHAQTAPYLGEQAQASEASLGFVQNTLSDTNRSSPFPGDGFAYNNTALNGTGSLFEPRIVNEDAMYPDVNDSAVFDEIHEMDLAAASNASSFIHTPTPTTYSTSSSRQTRPWHPPLHVLDPCQTVPSMPGRVPQPKRQLSLNTTVAAHSRAHRTSPMEMQLGRGSPWQP